MLLFSVNNVYVYFMNLDIRTLAVFGTVSSLIFGVWLIGIYRKQKTYPGFGYWTLSSLLLSLSQLLLSFRDFISDFFSIVVSDFLYFAAFIFIKYGLNQFIDRKVNITYQIVFVVLLLIPLVYFTYFQPDLNMRILLVFLVTAYFCFRISKLIYINLSGVLKIKYYNLSGLFFLFGIWQIYAIIVTVATQTVITDYMKAGITESLDQIFTASFFMIVYFGLVNLNATRLGRDLNTAKDKIETLEKFLPICANCKKIRDDDGKWEKVEDYISHKTSSTMTHSICPECTHELYPELYKKEN